jgi:hypothetical protein
MLSLIKALDDFLKKICTYFHLFFDKIDNFLDIQLFIYSLPCLYSNKVEIEFN